MPSARSLPLVVLVAVLALVAVPLAAAPGEEPPATPAAEIGAAAETAAAPAPLPWEPAAALPWEQKCETYCNEGTCTICYDCTGRCMGISCPWGDFQC